MLVIPGTLFWEATKKSIANIVIELMVKESMLMIFRSLFSDRPDSLERSLYSQQFCAHGLELGVTYAAASTEK